ncbi:sorbosone dehydrogenase family protein [Acidobacteriia bacterium AH_259_A11_L15]|nr:sorbosone dehydrogenase family protein [Acidobacteriia bacterium AH_259_A11_L15]
MKSRIGIFSTISLLLLVGCGMRSPSAENTAAATNEGLPPGFELNVFAEGLGPARFMDFGPDGTLYVGTNSRSGQVWALRDTDGDGRADQKAVFADGLSAPHSVFWHDPEGRGAGGWLYVGETHRVIRLRDTDGDLKADEREVVVADLPAWQQHFTRTVGFGPEGGLYVSVGSTCNVCEEDDPRRAAILRFDPGSPEETTIYARGLRNSVGLTWHPETGEMWATDNGRDWLGDDLPPEELNLIQPGKDYGWPYCYSNRLPDPDLGSPERCRQTEPPAFEMQAHSAPLGLEFYTGEMFPEEYRGDLFIAFHGSWNRSVPTGYKVVRVRFESGRPVGIEDFIGWLRGGEVKHRPVDVRTGPDGALYISDDRGGTIFRVTYSPAD